MNDFKPIIKNKKFRYLWISQVLSQVTINIMNFVLLVKLFTETGSTIATSLLWVSYALPAMLIGPFAAASVDMFDRRKVLMVTNLAQSVSIFLFALGSTEAVFSLYGLAMIYSFFNQFYVPAEQASLPSIVKKDDLAHANGLFFVTQQTSIIIGFGVGGILNQFLGFQNTLFLGSALIFFAFLSVTFLPSMKTVKEFKWRIEEALIGFFREILEGYRFIKKHRKISLPILILLSFHVSLIIIVVNVPVITTDILNLPVNLAGVALVIPAGIGTLIGSVSYPKLLKKGLRKRKLIESSLKLLLIALLILNFSTIFLGSLMKVVVGAITITLIGFSFVGIIIPSQTFLQEHTPKDFRGRVFGNFWFLSTIATVFPMMFSGVVTEYLGIRMLIILLIIGGFYLLVFSKAKGDYLLSNSKNDE